MKVIYNILFIQKTLPPAKRMVFKVASKKQRSAKAWPGNQ